MPEESSLGETETPHGNAHSYPEINRNATPAFCHKDVPEISPLTLKIRDRISQHGSIKFRDFMQMALYDAQHGYYASGIQRVGKQADYITSVSIGRCFGIILARRLCSYWEECGKPESFHIIEPGAHDGSLGADILRESQTFSPDFFQSLHYHMVETTPALLAAQQQKLEKNYPGKFTTHTSLTELRGLHGAILSNEMLDAFPVDLICFEGGKWQQLHVTESSGKFTFQSEECEGEELIKFCRELGDGFPEGYLTEYNPDIRKFTSEASAALASGLFITIDYGHHAEDYYHPDRSTGTLQTYHSHQKSDNPLDQPGEIDITSHVDFTRFITAAESSGFQLTSLTTQASYLTQHARQWLINMEKSSYPDSPTLLRQFQTLTHPAMLGTKFMVVEMKK